MTMINIDEIEYMTETTITIRESRRRTTVPKEIVDFLGFKNGDKLRWLLFKDGRIFVSKVSQRKSIN